MGIERERVKTGVFTCGGKLTKTRRARHASLAMRAGSSKLDEQIRRSAFELSKVSLTVSDLVLLLQATGKGALAKNILSRAKALHVADQPPKPLLQGKDLLALGVKPGKKMGELLAQVFNQQLKGKFDDSKHHTQKRLAVEWTKRFL
jgi:hypothetical protein